jgi:hypothetical protein
MILFDSFEYVKETFVAVVYCVLCFYFLNKFIKNQLSFLCAGETYLLRLGFITRFLGAIVFTLIHVICYRNDYNISDTENYHFFSVHYIDYLQNHHTLNDLFGGKILGFYNYLKDLNYNVEFRDNFVYNPQMYLVRLGTIINLLSFNSFFAKAIIFASIGSIGLLYMIKSVYVLYPTIQKKWLILSLMFLPSIVFWTSGLMKEPICIFAMGLFVFQIVKFGSSKKLSFKALIIAISALLLLGSIKIFLLIIIFVFGLIFLVLNFLYSMPFNKQNLVKYMPILMGIILFALFALNMPQLERFSLGEVLKNAEISYIKIRSSAPANSTYEACIEGTSFNDVVHSIPKTMNIVFIRPYFSEANKIFYKASASENIGFLLCLVIVGLSIIWKKTFIYLLDSPFVLALIFSSLIYFYFIAVSSANFGTLVRYKAVLMPFLLMALCIIFGRSLSKPRLT